MFRGSAYSIETEQDIMNNSDLMESQVKIALVGVSDVGKSSILGCIENEKFREDISNTQGFQLRFKKLRISNHIINLYVWDGAGDNILHFIHEGHFDQIDSILYVFDLTDEHSLHQLQQIHVEFKKYFLKKQKSFVAIVVGNKLDLINHNLHSISGQENYVNYIAEKFAARNDLLYLKVSAKKNNFITDTFVELIRQTLKSRQEGRTSRIFGDEEEKNNSSSGWCKNCKNCGFCQIF